MARSDCNVNEVLLDGECMEELIWLKIKHPEMTYDEINELMEFVCRCAWDSGRRVSNVDDLNYAVTHRVQRSEMVAGGFGGNGR